MSKLVEHAERELRRAGALDDESDYNGQAGRDTLALVKLFAAQGHSGGSAHLVLAMFARVANHKTLSPLTDDPEEWMEIGEDMLVDKKVPVWQSRRQSSCFSNDGGKTYYDIDESSAGYPYASSGKRLIRHSDPAVKP